MNSTISHLVCSRCGTTFGHREPHTTCRACRSPLLVEYDLDAARNLVSPEMVSARAAVMWRYHELLPVEDDRNVVSLGEGFTPIVKIPTPGLPGLLVKDEGLNPTGTFKARGASAGISKARELGVKHVALPTAGNAGGAWAAYGAAAGIRVHVAMPADAPDANKTECLLFGADLRIVEGLISDAGAHIAAEIEEHGWFDAATLKEPYRIEGKKTLGLEIAEQLGWALPGAIVYPAGGGVGIIGIYRALTQLLALGWVRGDMPRLIVVQAAGCAPLVRAFEEGEEESRFWEGAETMAAGLRVPKALGDFLVLEALRATGGTAVSVTEADMLSAMHRLASDHGIAAAPEGAATFAAALVLRESGFLRENERVVLVNTGSSAKYPEASRAAAQR